ncbi:MAG: GGDEF domain-containing protein [Terracidiphilus sp.]
MARTTQFRTRKRLFPARSLSLAGILLTHFSTAMMAASTPSPPLLTSLSAIHSLSNAEATQHLPVDFEATVTYYRDYERILYVQDGDTAIYILASTDVPLLPGDRVRVRGTTHESFRPYVLSKDFTVLRHGALPESAHPTFSELMHAQYDCKLVSMHGIVRSADLLNVYRHSAILQVSADGGNVEVHIDHADATDLKGLLDAEVDVTGAVSGKFDGKMQITAIQLHLSSIASLKILKQASVDPWAAAVTPMDEILYGYNVKALTPRVRVHGTITYYEPGAAVVLQDGLRSLWILTQTRDDLEVGDIADATGIGEVRDGFLTLTEGEVRDTHVRAPASPQATNAHELRSSHHIFDLITLEGRVVMEVREVAQDEYVLIADGLLFSAIYRHPNATSSSQSTPPLPPMKQIPVGSKVRVIGVCVLGDSDPYNGRGQFDVALRSLNDITVVAKPSLMTVRNLAIAVSILLFFVFAAGGWVWMLRRKVKQQTAAMAARIAAEAALERRRSHILEEINGKCPLNEILEQIAELVSFSLGGAPCWCQIGNNAPLGNHPSTIEGLRIASQEVPSPPGPAHGTIVAAFDQLAAPCANESEALSIGTWLASLAIETRGLYSDLVHRSEFDQLTEIHNRFSLERRLGALVQEATQKSTRFGLIYIDLDEFKQVNDQYGHRAGDEYLQIAAARMKRQLRPTDMLARLGGDEFAALIQKVQSRSDVEEIAARLSHCFQKRFGLRNCTLSGSASIGIAVFPEDGTTKDSLLSLADAAMYQAKKRTKEARSALSL